MLSRRINVSVNDYLAVQDDLLAKTREASSKSLASIFVAHLLHTPSKKEDEQNSES
jgi:hypothetical protein